MSEKLVLRSFKLNNIEKFVNSIDNTDTYYLFAAKHTEYEDEPTIEQPLDTESYLTNVYRQMIFAKKISNTDVMRVVNKNEWTSNTVYTQYDDNDETLYEKQFYTYVNDGDYYHVYKCLYNNNNAASTVQPNFGAVSADDEYYETSDGYLWKYMYTVSSTTVAKFSTSEYFPVTSNTSVVNAAVPGAIDVIKVVAAGNNYTNYLSGENRFSSNQLRISSNTRIYDISSNSTASNYNDFYNGCYIYITGGTGIGQYKKIVDYVANSTAKAIILESEFSNNVTVDSVYEIYPGVDIASDGQQTINAIARAIVNTVSNTIYKIDVLNRGAGYNIATANVYAHSSVGADAAELRVINSPYNGHGYDPISELGSTAMCISVTFANSESNTIPNTNDYRTIGIINNPQFANVSVQYKSKIGEPINDERVVKVKTYFNNSTTTFDENANTITTSNGDFTDLIVGDYLVLKNGNNYHIDTISGITNTTVLNLSSNIAFSANSTSPATVYYAVIKDDATVISANVTHVNLKNVINAINTDDKYFGLSSKCYFVANSTSTSGESKGFNTFINMNKLTGILTSGSFIDNETVYQSNVEIANAIFHSTNVKDSVRSFYLTDVYGSFQEQKTLIGQTSGATADINNSYSPEIIFKSGEIIYLENVDVISRDPAQSEKFKLIFEL